MTITEIYLIALLIIFAVPWLIWRVFRTDYWAPLVVVQIVGGILLGPGVLGAAIPDYYAFVFRPEVITALNGVAWWAVMLFVWVAGIELDLTRAWAHRRETGITAGLALGMPLLLGAGAALILLQWPGWQGASGAGWQVVLGLGMACAVTALPILILFMEKLEILRRPLGQRVLRYASLDDIAIWGVLALILLDWERIGRQGVFLVAFALAALAMRWLMTQLRDGDRWAVGLIWLAACGLAADWAGLHYMVGAFLAGAVLEARWFGEEAMDRFRNVVLLTIMPVFFLSTGLRTQWETGGLAVFAAAGLLLAAAVAGKLLGARIAGALLGWSRDEARLIGWLLQTKALIMIIFANTAFTALLLMAVASTMLTIPMVSPLLKRLEQRVDADA
jgi:Kef-type K+ transport system membrane component KefB